jgi:hypothetical protein
VSSFSADILAAPEELVSVDFAGAAIAFWARRMARLACPDCRAVGSLHVQLRPYGTFVYCVIRGCPYERRHLERAEVAS